jgi:hypothetical protein
VKYASPEGVYVLLEIDPDEAAPEELDALDLLEGSVADRIDFACQRSFGVAAAPETRDISYSMSDVRWYTDRIVLDNGYVFFGDFYGGGEQPYVTPWGMKNVTAINVDGTWDGTVWDDETELEPENWMLRFRDKNGWYHGLTLPTSGYRSVRVTAEWEDLSASATVPDDIQLAATFITADEWRILHMSPAGEIGPAGLSVYLRNAWEYDIVKQAIKRHTFRQLVV